MAVNKNSIYKINKINRLRKVKNQAIIDFIFYLDSGGYDALMSHPLLDYGVNFGGQINTYVAAKIAKTYFYANPTKANLSIFAKKNRFGRGHAQKVLAMFDKHIKGLYAAYDDIYDKIYQNEFE